MPGWKDSGQRNSGAALVLYAGRGLTSRAQLLARSTPGFPGPPAPEEYLAGGFASGDFNGDGHADLAMYRYGLDGSGLIFVYGSRNGLVPSSAVEWASRSGFGGPASADVDRDGYSDLLVFVGRTQQTEIFHGGPGGLARESSGVLPLETGDIVRFADLDRDHRLELVYRAYN